MANFIKIISLLSVIYFIGLLIWANRMMPVMEQAHERGESVFKIWQRTIFWFVNIRTLQEHHRRGR